MRLEDLFETPQLKPTDQLVDIQAHAFITQKSMDRLYDMEGNIHVSDDTELFVIMRKNSELAVIGTAGIREPDKSVGINVLGEIYFKYIPSISGIKPISKNDLFLQVSQVKIANDVRSRGYAMYAYLLLAKKGYIVVSDNTQYIGGKELWKKIAKQTVGTNYNVYVIDHGDIRCDENGKPIIYDGSNIDDSGLWSTGNDKKYTLFVLKIKS